MDLSKSVARKIMMIVLMVIAMITVAFSVNASHVHANAAANAQVSVQKNQKNNNRNKNNKNGQNKQFNRIFKIAKSKLGDRYVWGGNGPYHFDCSGFTRYVYQKGLHKTLPRLAGDQYYDAKKVSKANRRPGDLVFFGGSRRSITHVGMYIGHGKMIDAQNRGVIIEKIAVPWWHAVGYSRPANLR